LSLLTSYLRRRRLLREAAALEAEAAWLVRPQEERLAIAAASYPGLARVAATATVLAVAAFGPQEVDAAMRRLRERELARIVSLKDQAQALREEAGRL
jgi:hypothetical protein